MCLSVVYYSADGENIGYKVFERRADNRLIAPFYSTSFKINTWHKAEQKEYERYLAGFHLFTNITDAQNWLGSQDFYADSWEIHKVKYRGINSFGHEQRDGKIIPVICANEILIIPKSKQERTVPYVFN